MTLNKTPNGATSPSNVDKARKTSFESIRRSISRKLSGKKRPNISNPLEANATSPKTDLVKSGPATFSPVTAISPTYTALTNLESSKKGKGKGKIKMPAPSPDIPTGPPTPVKASTQRKFSFGSRRASSPLPDLHPAFGPVPLSGEEPTTDLARRATSASGSTTGDTTPTSPAGPASSKAAAYFPDSTPSTPRSISCPNPPKNSVPLSLNTNLPPYVLDRIHPCIPFPATWGAAHDRYIAYLDVQDYHLPAMVRRVKQRFPELRVECITPGMIDKRLRILDMRWDCEYYKDGVERLKGSGGLDVVGEIGSEMSEAEIGRVLSVRDMTPVPKANIKKVTIGSPMRKKGVMDDRHNRRVSTGGMSAKLVINRTGSGRSTVDSTPLRGMSPKTIEEQDAEVKEMAPKEMDFAQEQDLAPKRKQSRGGLFGKGKKKEEVKSKEKDDVKGKEKVEDVKGKARAKDDDEPFGVPSVMRTSSGRPVLR